MIQKLDSLQIIFVNIQEELKINFILLLMQSSIKNSKNMMCGWIIHMEIKLMCIKREKKI